MAANRRCHARTPDARREWLLRKKNDASSVFALFASFFFFFLAIARFIQRANRISSSIIRCDKRDE